MPNPIKRVEAAINALKKGEMIVLTDSPDRENEGDLIIPAEKITPETMNFMIRNGTGIVCLSLTAEQLEKLNLPLMLSANDNTSLRGTPFTISIDAKDGITTGVSAHDRTHTVLTAIHPEAKPNDLVKPGHIFPLQAKTGGVFERAGHTEGSIDIVKLAGFMSAAVLCEIMNPDGTMTRGKDLTEFAKKHSLTMLSIEDIMIYRYQHEDLIADQATTSLPLANLGNFKISVIKEKITGLEHIILLKEKNHSEPSTLVRIHSACITGDLFSSMRCDCSSELKYSLERVSKEGGMLIYLNQEGRGIGLLNKIKAYVLQDQGFDTVEANEKLGLPVDSRQYYIAANILRNYSLDNIRLLTNNPEKIANLEKYGITNIEREPMPAFYNEYNHHYLKVKQEKLKHIFLN